jgi:PST family polysaccharide transporter
LSEPPKNAPSTTNLDHHFRTDHLKNNLKDRSVRGGAITVTAQACKFVLQTGATIVLARLLTPQDYGLVGMVTAVTGLINLFKDLGLSQATVQKAEINHSQVSTLFWVNVVVSFFLAVMTAALAPAVARFYGEPRLTWIMVVLSSGYIFSGLNVQHAALLNRQMRYGTLVITDIIARLASIIIAIVLACFGARYWALISMTLTGAIINTAGDWLMCGWFPGPPSWDSSVRSMLAFGRNLTGFQAINYFSRNFDNVLIGRYWGPQQLGLYVKAYQLLLLPLTQINSPIQRVAIPTLSRLVDSPDRYRQVYLRIEEKLTILTIPVVVFLIATSDWLILLLLGPQWSDASRIFAWLSFVALTQPVSYTTGWIFISQGRTSEMFKWGIIAGSITIASFIIGLPWGAEGVAAAYSIAGLCIRTPLLFWYVGRIGPVRTSDFYHTAAPALCASLCALLVLLAFRRWVEVSNPLIGLIIAFGITAGVTLLVLTMLPSGRSALQDFRGLLALLVKRQKKKPAL